MDADLIVKIRKLSQLYAYTSIQLHEAVARKAGLSGTDHKYLGFLLQKGSMTAGELAHITGLTTGAVTGLIDRLEKKRLVKRQLDQDDRRKVVIVPDAAKITALLMPLYKDFQSGTDALVASFSGIEVTTLETYFLKAIALMNETMDAINGE